MWCVRDSQKFNCARDHSCEVVRVDPAPFHALTSSTQEEHALRAKPSSIQTSPLSDLQILVKESKKIIIDPVLERCAAYAAQLSLEDEDEGENVDGSRGGMGNGGKQHKEYWMVEMERERERQKIRELKKRKLHAGLSLPGMGAAGVFVRNDVEDESAVVDVTLADDCYGGAEKTEAGTLAHTLVDGKNMQLDVDPDLTPNGRHPVIDKDSTQTKGRPSRTRRVTAKHQQWQEESYTSSKKRKRQAGSSSRSTVAPTPTSAPAPHAKPAQTSASVQDPGSPMNLDEDEDESENENEAENGSFLLSTESNSARGCKNTPKAKPKSQTYKQAWSESEQNLLEQLLEKIPDGEKNRCVFGCCAILLLCPYAGTIGGKRSREL